MNLKKTLSTRILKAINENSLLHSGDRVLIAFSGGADSVCLLYLLNELKDSLGVTLYAAHLNHSLRGEAADADELFVRNFCDKLGIKCFVFKKDVREYAKKCGMSEEMAGREMRYSLFFDVMEKENIGKLAVGHHADDQAETVLMHLMRGSGADGLSGMHYSRDKIIRPLLGCTKTEILELCEQEKLDFCTDATNFDAVYSRNKVRLELIPKMQEFNPNITKTLVGVSEILADESDFMNKAAEKEFSRIVKGNSCNISELFSCHVALQKRVVRKMIESVKGTSKDISADYVNKVLTLAQNKNTGKKINLGGDISAWIEYERLIIEKNRENKEFSYKIEPGKPFEICENKTLISIEKTNNGDFNFPEGAEFIVRTRQSGDRIYPKGMSGSKKLKDFFIDEKVPRDEREKAVLVLCNGEIAAVFYSDKAFFDRRFNLKGNFRIKIIKPIENQTSL